VKIAGMVLWVLTAGIGGYLLAVGFAAQRARREAASEAAEASGASGSARAQMARQLAVLEEAVPQDEPMLMGSAAVLAGPSPTASASAPPRPEIEGSPLLEFVHPALALTGLTLWIFYTVSGDRLFAWIGFGIVLAAIGAGVGWVLMSKHTERRKPAAGSGFPDHLVLLHGAAALCTFALVAVCLFAVVHL
jgi:Flp pilus assembly protein TadB